MNLIIDVGNTRVKLAVFQHGNMVFQKDFVLGVFEKEISTVLKAYIEISRVIVSSVGDLQQKAFKFIEKRASVLLLNRDTKVPFVNAYKTPNTLGVDRIALVSAASHQFSSSNVLVIDAGTCITYDFLSNENTYLGGAISPGITMRYKSLNNLTANLPLLKRKEPKRLIGNSSKESIHSGVINGVLMEIDGVVQQYVEDYEDLTVILTGGDADFLSKRLKNSIFANSNFLLEGLNFILEFNSNE